MLWRKVRQGLSAGRVQSVATRLVVERERSGWRSASADYWDVTGTFAPARGRRPSARSTPGWSRSTAPGRHRPRLRRRRQLTGDATSSHLDEAARDRAWSPALDGADFAVRSVEDKPYTRRPAAPFITSTLQQEASRKLRFSARADDAGRAARCTRTATSPTCAPTRDAVRRRRSTPPARRPAELYGAGVRARRAARLREQGQERPGGARGDPPRRRLVPHAGAGGRRAARRRVRALRADLEAHRRLADGRRARARPRPCGSARHGRRRARRRVLARPAPSSPSAASSPPTRRAATRTATPTVARTATSGAAAAAGRGDALDAPRRCSADGHAHVAAAALHRGHPGQGAGGARHRPARRRTRLRSATIIDRGYVFKQGHGAGADLAGVRRDAGCSRSTSAGWSTTTSPPRWRRTSTGSPTASEDRGRLAARFYFGDGDRTSTRGCKTLVAEDLGDIDAREVNSIPIGDGIVLRVGRYGPVRARRRADGDEPRAGHRARGPGARRAHRREGPGAAGRAERRPRARHATRRPGCRSSRRRAATARTSPRCCPRTPPKNGAAAHRLAASRRCRWTRSRSTTRCGCCPAAGGRRRPETARRSPRRTAATGRTSRRAPTRGRSTTEEQMFDITLERGAGDLRPAQAARARGAPRRRCASSATTRSPGCRSWSRRAGSGPYVTDGRPTRRCARATRSRT